MFTETFIDGSGATPPSRWETAALPGDASGAVWRFDNPMGRNLPFPMVAPVAMFDAGFLPAGTGHAEVSLQLRQSFELMRDWTNSFMLMFDHSLEIDADVEVRVEVSPDGSTWREAISWSDETIAMQREIVDISSLLSGANIGYIRFTWSGPVDGDGYWAFDNVRVFAAWDIDAGLMQINSPVMPLDAGVHDLEVVIGNFGVQPISEATIRWGLDGGSEEEFYWNEPDDPLLFGESRSIPLGPIPITEPVLLNVWLDLPGDENPDNDNISIELRPRMDGSQPYIIGGPNPDFSNFEEAVLALSQSGISAPVTFHVVEGLYAERVEIGAINGASSINTISFLSHPDNNNLPRLSISIQQQAVLNIQGSSYLRFEGIDFSGQWGVEVEGQAANLTFSNCQFSANEVAMLIRGGSSNVRIENSEFHDATLLLGAGETEPGHSPVQGLYLVGNRFLNAQSRAIHIQDISDVEIASNVFEGVKFGLAVERGSDLDVYNNRLFIDADFHSENAGLRLNQTESARVFNNFISSQGPAISTGIRLEQTTNTGVYYNSVHMANVDVTADSKALRIDAGNSGLDVRNNIFSIEEQGYPVYVDGPLGGVTLNHNNYYHPRGRIGWLQNAVHNSLADWQGVVAPQDAQSLAVKPFFTSLTAPEIGQSVLFGAADPDLPMAITHDIEGDLRGNPTIGAREFDACGDDAGINGFVSPSAVVSGGGEDIVVMLQNHGTNYLDQVMIYWEISGGGDYVSNNLLWTVGLDAGASEMVELESGFIFPPGEVSIRAWTEYPNDCNEENDAYEIRVAGSLCGPYTIGSGGDYPDFSSALQVLNTAGIQCEVVFTVLPGIYDEQILIGHIPGSEANAIMFESASDADQTRIRFLESGQSPVHIRGAQNIHFRNISFEGHTPMLIENHANNVGFEGCRFVVTDLVSSSTQGVRITNNARDIVFSGNIFQDGFHSINIPPGQGAGVRHITITNNDFHSPFHDAIQTHGADQMLIHNNRFHDIRLGILSGSTNNLTISNNRFYIETDAGQDNINRGIFVSGGNNIRIKNNFILSTGFGATTGIRIRNTNNSQVFFNSINILNTNPQGFNQGLLIDGGNHVDIRNNLARVRSNGYPVSILAMPDNFTLDYNNYFHPEGLVGLFNGTEYESLGNWQVATGQDENSLSVDPFFSDGGGPDVNQALLVSGFPEAGDITEDINGETRHDPPTIGAREYEVKSIDVGVAGFVSPGIQVFGDERIKVVLQNHGTTDLEAVTIHWEVNGMPQEPFDWPSDGSVLAYQDTVHVELGDYSFESGSYVIRSWTAHPNDENPHNDLSELTVYGGLAGDYRIGASLDFDDIDDAVAALNRAGITDHVRFLFLEDQTMSVVIDDFRRFDEDLTVTFLADKHDGTSVQIHASTGVPFAMKLEEGVKNLYFEGIHFRGPSAVIISPGSSDIYFERCNFTATGSQARAVRIGAGSSDIEFLHGEFWGGDHSILLEGNALEPIGRVLIQGNQFGNTTNQAVRASWVDHFTLIGNQFEAVRSGVRVELSDSLLIRENWIAMQVPAGAARGIEIINSAEVRVYNNFIFGQGDGLIWGIEIRGNQETHMYMYFNTVNIVSSHTLSRAMVLNGGHTLQIYYNIFTVRRGYALFIVQMPSTIAMRSNKYFNQTSQQIIHYNDALDMLAWNTIAADQGIDDQSINENPLFNPEDSPIYGDVDFNLAERLDEIRFDIRGARRHPTRPAIGCYESFFDFGVAEIILPKIDCNTNAIDGFHVRLIYSGLDDEDFETLLTVNYQLDAGQVKTEYVQLIEEYDEMVVYIEDAIEFSEPGLYELSVWLPDVPNFRDDDGDDYDGNDSLSISWEILPPPEITSIGFDPACNMIHFYADVPPNQPDPVVSTIWHFGDGHESSVLSPAHQYDDPGTYLVTFFLTTQSECVIERELTVQAGDPDAELTIIDQQVLPAFGAADDGRIEFTVSGGMAPYEATMDGVNWVYDDVDNPGEFTFADLAPGLYTFEVRDMMNCTISIEELEVIWVPPLSLDQQIIEQYCQADSDPEVTLFIDGGVPPYNISVNGTAVATIDDSTWVMPAPVAGQDYIFEVVDNMNQESILEISLASPVAINPVIILIDEDGVEHDTDYHEAWPFEITLRFMHDDPPHSWLWQVGTITSTLEQPQFTIDWEGDLEVILETWSDAPGHCREIATFSINSELRVEIATVEVFTPGGQGTYQYFEVFYRGLVSLEVDIFDLRGRLVHRIDSLGGRWDGNYQNGRPAPDGLYPFFLRATGYHGLDHERSGVVQLIRDAVLVFPNPVTETFYIDPKGNLSGPVNIDIIDLQANVVKSFRQVEFYNLIELNASDLHEGLYVIRLSDDTNVFHHKIRVVR